MEPPGGDRMRAEAPVAFDHWNAGKRTVALDLSERSDRDAFLRLVDGADVLVESAMDGGTGRPFSHQELARRRPELIHVVVTPFGLSGPRASWKGTDLVACAAGGMMALSGEREGPPLVPPREQAFHLAGAHAAIGALLALAARRRTGRGQLVEISMQEAVAATLEYGALSYIHQGVVHRRDGSRYPHVPHRLFRCADGWVAGGYGGSPRMWTGLVEWMAEVVGRGEMVGRGLSPAESAPEMVGRGLPPAFLGDLTDARYADDGYRFAQRLHIDEVVEAFTRTFTRAELTAEAQRRRLPWASVDTPAEVARNPQLADRDFFVDVQSAGGSSPDAGFAFEFPPMTRPLRLAVPPPPERGVLPGDWSSAEASSLGTSSRGSPHGALSGVRVLDLTWVLAGPYATKILAEHGADVIKVESRHRPDPTRFSSSMHLTRDPTLHPDTSGYFNNFNRNKRGILLNLQRPEGLALLTRLIPHCDVLIENFSAGVLERWGLGYERLRALREDIVVVRMAGMGQTGPWRNHVTYADALAAIGGITAQTGPRGDEPVGVAFGLGDMIAALHAVVATVTALEHRARTGRGREIDLSQLEAVVSHTGTSLLEAVRGLAPTSYDGNRHPAMAPHGAFPCRGEDRWCALAVQTDEQWRALCRIVGVEPAERLASVEGRKAHEDEVERFVAAWTRDRDPFEAAEVLQSAGIPAAPVEDGRDLVEGDEHLRARGFYVELEHPVAGQFPHEGVVARLHDTPGGINHPAPRLGEHTDEVLSGLLGLRPDEIDGLRAAGVLE